METTEPPVPERRGKLRRRSSILKMPVPDDAGEQTEELTCTRRASRRVSFAERFHVQEFCSDEVTVTMWAKAYETEAHITDSSGEMSAAAAAAQLSAASGGGRTPLADATQLLDASMDLTDIETSFALQLANTSAKSGRGSSSFLDKSMSGALFSREDSDPDKENLAPRAAAGPSAGAKTPLAAVGNPSWLGLRDGAESPPPGTSSSGAGLLELLGCADAETPPFLRRPAPGGVLDLLRRAGIVSQSPQSPPVTGHERSALELLGDDGETDTTDFLRFLDPEDDDLPPQGRQAFAVRDNATVHESAYMEITSAGVSRTQGGASHSSGAHSTVWSSSHASFSKRLADPVGLQDEESRGKRRPVAAGDRTVVDDADMEFTNAVPRGLTSGLTAAAGSVGGDVSDVVPRSSSRLGMTVADGADMELTAAVPQVIARSSSHLNKSIMNASDMEMTGIVPRHGVKSSSRGNQSVVHEADLKTSSPGANVSSSSRKREAVLGARGGEADAFSSQSITSPPPAGTSSSGLLELLGCSDTETPPFLRRPAPGGVLDLLRRHGIATDIGDDDYLDEDDAVFRPVAKSSDRLNKSVVDAGDMELTAAVPQRSTKPSAQFNKSIVDAGDMELTAAVPQGVRRSSADFNKSIVDDNAMEMTGAVPQAVKSSSQANKTIADGDDMEFTAAVPQTVKSSSQANKTIADGDDMEFTAAVPQGLQKSTAVLPQVVMKFSTLANKTIADGDDMEFTAAVPQATLKSSTQSSKTIVTSEDMSFTAAVPEIAEKPSTTASRPFATLNKSVVGAADMELTAAVPQVLKKSSTQSNKTIMDDNDMEFTAAVHQVLQKPPTTSAQQHVVLDRTVVDAGDMELTSAVPRGSMKASAESNKMIADGDDMEMTAAAPQVSLKPPSTVAQRPADVNKSIVDAGDMELTAAVPQVTVKSSAQSNKTIADGDDMDFTSAVSQVLQKPSTADAQRLVALNKSMVDCADMELTAAVPQVMMKSSDHHDNSIRDLDGMDTTAAASASLMAEKRSSALEKSVVDCADMEMTAAVPEVMQKPPTVGLERHATPNKSVVDAAEMELTGAVPQTMEERSARPFVTLNKSVVDAADVEAAAAATEATMSSTDQPGDRSDADDDAMEMTAAVPQLGNKSSTQSGETIAAGQDMSFTAAVPDIVEKPPMMRSAALNKSVVDAADMELTAAAPQGKMSSTQCSKTITAGDDMSFTAAVPQALKEQSSVVTRPFVTLNKSVVDATDMELTSAVPGAVMSSTDQPDDISDADDDDGMEMTSAASKAVDKSSSTLNKSVGDCTDMEFTAAVPQAEITSSTRPSETVADGEDFTASVPETVERSSITFSRPFAALNKSVVDATDMELTSAIPHVMVKSSSQPECRSVTDDKGMEATASVSQTVEEPPAAASKRFVTLNKSVVDAADMELTAAVPQATTKYSSQPSKTIVDDKALESPAVPQTVERPSTATSQRLVTLNKSVVDCADMELTAAVPGPAMKSSASNKTITDGEDMEVTGAVPQLGNRSSTQSSKTIIAGEDMSFTAAVQRFLPPNKSVVDCRDMELTAAVPEAAMSSTQPGNDDMSMTATTNQVPRKPSTVSLNKTVADGGDMELTAVVPQARMSSSTSSKTIVAGEDMELTAALTQTGNKSSTQSSKTIIAGEDMSFTAAVPRAVERSFASASRPFVTLNKSVVDYTDMEFTAAAPQMGDKSSTQSGGRSVADGEDMNMTGAVSQATARPSAAATRPFVTLNNSVVDYADMELTAAVPHAGNKSSTQSSETIADDNEMEDTSPDPRLLKSRSDELSRCQADPVETELPTTASVETSSPSKSVAEETGMEMASTAPQTVSKSPDRPNKSVVNWTDMELTAAVSQASTRPTTTSNKSISDGQDMDTAASAREVADKSIRFNKSIFDGADMEMTSAIPEVMKTSSQSHEDNVEQTAERTNEPFVTECDEEMAEMVVSDPASQVKEVPVAESDELAISRTDDRLCDESNRTLIEEADVEMDSATPPKLARRPSQFSKTLADIENMEEVATTPQAASKLISVSPKYGRLFVPSTTPSPPKRLLEEADDSETRSPKSPRLEAGEVFDPVDVNSCDVSLEASRERHATEVRRGSQDTYQDQHPDHRAEERGSSHIPDASGPGIQPKVDIEDASQMLPQMASPEQTAHSMTKDHQEMHSSNTPHDRSVEDHQQEMFPRSASPGIQHGFRLESSEQAEVHQASPQAPSPVSSRPEPISSRPEPISSRPEPHTPSPYRPGPRSPLANASISEMFRGTPSPTSGLHGIDLHDELLPDISVINDSLCVGAEEPPACLSLAGDLSRLQDKRDLSLAGNVSRLQEKRDMSIAGDLSRLQDKRDQSLAGNLSRFQEKRDISVAGNVSRRQDERETSRVQEKQNLSVASNISRRQDERETSRLHEVKREPMSCRSSGRPQFDTTPRRAPSPKEELLGMRRSHGVPEHGAGGCGRVAEEASWRRRTQLLDDSPRSRARPASPERTRPHDSTVAHQRTSAASDSRRSQVTEPPRGREPPQLAAGLPDTRRSQAGEPRPESRLGREPPPLPPPLTIPDCRSLTRSLRAHLQSYRRARETSEREVREVLDAFLARRRDPSRWMS